MPNQTETARPVAEGDTDRAAVRRNGRRPDAARVPPSRPYQNDELSVSHTPARVRAASTISRGLPQLGARFALPPTEAGFLETGKV